MLNIIRLLSILFAIAISLVACRDTDVQGDLLRGFKYGQNTMGDDRFLYQEVTSSDTLAQYHYTGRKLSHITGKKYRTQIEYSGDRVSVISHHSTLPNGDIVTLTQDFVYSTVSGGDVLEKIIEKKEVKTPASVPGGAEVIRNFHATYDITYNAQKKIETILKQEGEAVAGVPTLTNYTKNIFTYDANVKNITQNTIEEGTLSAGVLSAPVSTHIFEYIEYDERKSPYQLLQIEYLVHRLSLQKGAEAHIFSQQTPKKYTHSGSSIPVPLSISNGELEYDADGYLTVGWQRIFEYRPF